MKISHLALQAFIKTAETLNITQAASKLHLTQSALSQRLAHLETELEVTLFIREPRGLKLTEAGERLLRFALLNQKFEEEMLQDLMGSATELSGSVRIAAYSSVLRSVLIPALSVFLQKNPKVTVSFQSFEMIELEGILKTANADIIVTDYNWDKKGIIKKIIGTEEFVVIENKQVQSPKDVYLDHGPSDNATEDFFKQQNHPPQFYRRSFMGDVYGIIDGVELGLGRAVMSKHLIRKNKKIKVLKQYQKMKRPVCMYYFEQPYYSNLMKIIASELIKNSSQFLN